MILRPKNFLGLIYALSKLRGLKRLRISSIEPTTIPEEIFQMMADPSHCLMPYLHVPMQSGCDAILGKMRRKYELLEMREFFDRAVAYVPGLCIGTDLMVGFPGEGEEEFEKTCATFMEFPLSLLSCLYVFGKRWNTRIQDGESSSNV